MLASSNTNQISSFQFMNQSSSIEKSIIQIHDENHDAQNPMSRLLFEQQIHPPSLQLIDCYNYNYNCNYNPFLDDHQELILGHILYSQKHQLLGNNNNSNFFDPEIGLIESITNNTSNEATAITTTHNSSPKKATIDHSTSPKNPISRKRSSSSKKDRHSKISTSKGPRDRRMRLSLEIARNFFDLQDMLGFDKASKTVEWLFTKSRSAIKELKEKYLSEANSKSSCDNSSTLLTNFSKEVVPSGKKRRRLMIVDKESRFRARTRARERTRAKTSIQRGLEISKSDFEGNPDGVCKIGDVIEEISTKSKSNTNVSLCENEKVLESKEKNSASLMDKRVSKEICSDEIHLLPYSSMDIPTLPLDTMKASSAGLKLLELEEIDGVLIFYGE